jgi:hypothetical protein
MVKGREESDGREVPQDRRKAVVTEKMRGGKATTASEQVRQFGLFSETADSPKGADGGVDASLLVPAPHAEPKSENAKRRKDVLPAMATERIPSAIAPAQPG